MSPFKAFRAALLGVLSLAASGRAVPTYTNTLTRGCKAIPGDAAWPSLEKWNSLNETVGGRLVATKLLGSICHKIAEGTLSVGRYNETACDALQTAYDDLITHVDWSGEIVNPYWQGNTCSPWTSSDKECLLGHAVSYAVNISADGDIVGDIQAGMTFAKENNIRLVVKNTGHDFLGRSTGTGALSLWMHNLQGINHTDTFQSGNYSGPAVTLRSGTQGFQAYEYAHKNGYRIIGGECPTVGIAGGYTTGGGHSILSSKYGMAVDGVLEWEVVTPEGEHVWATPYGDHSDLYWALSGGGGSTWGVTLGFTTKIYNDDIVGAGNFSFSASGIPYEAYLDAVAATYAFLPNFTDAGNSILWYQFNTSFESSSITMPDKNSDEVAAAWAPLLQKLNNLGVNYTFETRTDPSYYQHADHDQGPLPYGNESLSLTAILNSRIVPRSLVSDISSADAKAFHVAIQNITTQYDGRYIWGCVSLSTSKWKNTYNSVLPAWRDSVAHCVVQTAWDRSKPYHEMIGIKEYTTRVVVPYMEKYTPGGHVYINELDPLYQGDWKKYGYGKNYNRLLSIKNKYDPDGLFWSHFSVGSDGHKTDSAGRLCKA
ncbi:putative isoamyl alcohol oxidase [Xylaria acuta]|nr:putative isoamyl alcohol oxidase [Xylaria acuta]